jgi:SnoaL-like domain
VTGESDIQRLLDLEAIKQLKAKYFLYMDTKEWEAWRQLFTEDLVVEGTNQPPDANRDTFIDGVRASLANVQSCHHGHMPVIELTSETTARGVWAMYDDLRFPEKHPWNEGYPRRVGYGHYEEEYRKVDGEWRISFMRLSRLLVWRETESGPLVLGGVPSAGKQFLDRESAPVA